MSDSEDPEELRGRLLDGWDSAARGWRRSAASIQASGMPVSAWLVEHLQLQPGETVLELAAGPGDTGFLAAELVKPGGSLISSDGSEQMLQIARDRAQAQGIANVEFRQLQLEWIDMDTASVDAILCRWGVMLLVDPAAALSECRRVLRPGGRAALAVWAPLDENPWASVPASVVQAMAAGPALDPALPGPFALSTPGRLMELIHDAGFVEVTVESVEIERRHADFDAFLDETLNVSQRIAAAWTALDDDGQAEFMARLAGELRPYEQADGTLSIPGASLVALAHA